MDLIDHWPFLAAALVLAAVGQVFSSVLWTAERAKSGTFWRLGRATRPVHPVFVGAALGLCDLPGPGGSASVLYYAAAGVMSTWAYDVAKGIMRQHGIEPSA